MKIDINRIPTEGLTLEEDIAASLLDLDTEIIKLPTPIKVKAGISKITNTVSVNMSLTAGLYVTCSRCLNEFRVDLRKDLKLNYPVNPALHSRSGVNKLEPVIDTSTSSLDFVLRFAQGSRTILNKVKNLARDDPERVEGSLSVNGERSRTIDLNPEIRDQIILDYPMKPLCSPDCKGLCPKCGKNLNEGGCSCAIT